MIVFHIFFCFLSPSSCLAWWIAHRAVKICFDHEDKLNLSPFDTTAVWEQIKKHFNIETRYDLLDHCYAKFEKAFFANLCEKLSQLASKGDPLAMHLFDDAGRYLAKATAALLPHVSNELLINNNLNVVCVGSVWKSWDLLKFGFSREILKSRNKFGLNLISLTQAMAIGAVYLAADAIDYKLPRDYVHNYDVFQHFTPNTMDKTNGTLTNGNDMATKTVLNGDRLQNGSNNTKTTTTTNGNTLTNGTQTTNGLKSNSTHSAILVKE